MNADLLETNNLLFDKRLTERLLRQGKLTRKALNKHLDGLTDVESNAAFTNLAELRESRPSVATPEPEETTEEA